MIVLDTTSKSITIVMSGAPATTNPHYTTAYADNNGTSFTEGASDGTLNGTTAITVISAPASSTRRVINTITVENTDTAAVTITVGYVNGANTRTLAKVTLQVGDTWTTSGAYDTNGNIKQVIGSVNLVTQVSGTLPIANGGTGQSTANAAFNALAPSQATNSGKYLTTDGTNTSWATVTSSGTVTSVSATVPSFLSVTGSPITTSGTLAISYSGTALPVDNGGTGATSASAARTSLGLVIGTDVLSPSGSGASLTSLNATNISSGTLAKARLPTGTVLQVVQTVKSDTFSSSSGTFVDITGMSVTITPTSASSKIFVDIVMTCGAPAVTPRFLVLRGSTSIGIGDANGSRQRASFGTGWSGDSNQMTNMSWKFLDSPATTSATTYKVQGLTDSSTFFINRASNYPDNATLGISVISTITVWEIAA